MKYLLIISLTILFQGLIGQHIPSLDKVPKGAKLSNDQSIIYGDFIQRLGFSSGGYPQYIIIKNIESNMYYKFNVKTTYKSRKDNTFCYYINPGSYLIYSYHWTQSTGLGGTFYKEPIFKGIDATKYNEYEEIVPYSLVESDSVRYKFEIKESSIHYLGTWKFDSGLVSFVDEKEKFDPEIETMYKKLNFNSAFNSIPE
jgi:hypothetical protein